MKQLLTIVMLSLCFAGKSKEKCAADFGLNIDFPELHKMLSKNDTAMDNYLLSKDWEYKGYYYDSASTIATTVYGFGSDTYGGVEFQLVIFSDVKRHTLGVTVVYMTNSTLNTYMTNQAIKSGYRYDGLEKTAYSVKKQYSNPIMHLFFVTSSDADGDAGTGNDSRIFKAQKYMNSVYTQKYYDMRSPPKKDSISQKAKNIPSIYGANWSKGRYVLFFIIPVLGILIIVWLFRKKYLYDKWLRKDGYKDAKDKSSK